MPEFSVAPYRELTFDADGDVQGRQLEALRALRVKDLIVFAHGWNNDRSLANKLYDRFFAPFGALAPAGTTGYVGVMWPSMRFTDEPIPDFDPRAAVEPALRPELDEATRQALRQTFPDRAEFVDRLARMLTEQPTNQAAFDEFGLFVRKLVEVPLRGTQASFAGDIEAETAAPQSDPAMLFDDTAAVCRGFTEALEELGAVQPAPREGTFGIGLDRLWNGGKELLRQGTYYAMKRRAGTVGQLGLGPALGELADRNPDMRIHLVGHSFGARLVSFALRGLPRNVSHVKSVTLLQGAFSHYAFAPRLPHQADNGGVLRGQERRIDGPLVCCHSEHDAALKVFYPLASRLAGDSMGLLGDEAKWSALGYDGIKAVDGVKRLTLAQALDGRLPKDGCVNVDAAAKVRRGGPPSGAHSDILHKELAQVVLAAGRVRA
ncbi:serine-threonine protein kinase [Streptomyces sp. TRM66268-LWL]|uniref:Serine-threonine protein kinase n=1 Tax=Streptomyces polyasparticus TaxID=2767826 RepID=A0ABR7SM12_9ACTN|nr:serine-threonine protein kinase [Streptomyces polyasparticus]MBC9715403.1 serine-threonine protein kinase [Streptomyces polyasparticus]